jgi:hypothetical protein
MPGRSRLGQDLEAVADAEHGDARLGPLLDLAHDRGMGRDGAAAEVIAIGEAAGHDDEIDLGDIAVPVPDHPGRLAHGMPKSGGDVMLAIGAGEDDDGGVHGP